VSHPDLVAGLGATLREQPLLAIPLLFGAGLATSLTPWVYPMIPITAGVLSGLGAGRPARSRTLVLTLAYAAGLALVYSLLGLLAGMTGTLFGTSYVVVVDAGGKVAYTGLGGTQDIAAVLRGVTPH
jgi:cytochrome c biogenesis protein CcdA